MKILVTGGCGFIGSNFIEYLLEESGLKDLNILNLDKETYAGRGRNLEHMKLDKLCRLIKGDICNKKLVDSIFADFKPDLVFNFAGESHVDRGNENSRPFRKTNYEGAGVLLDAALKFGIERFVQIGTDEVYGSLDNNSRSSLETDKLEPRTPYAATKAAADIFAISYFYTHRFPIVITRSSNNYGPYQYPEKFIPKAITDLIDKKPITLMWSEKNPGKNIRDWVHIKDNCKAIYHVSQYGRDGEIYNISGNNERTNIDVAGLILKYFNYDDEMIKHVNHRDGHDFRYSINWDKLKNIGFINQNKNFENELNSVIKWYIINQNWWRPLKK